MSVRASRGHLLVSKSDSGCITAPRLPCLCGKPAVNREEVPKLKAAIPGGPVPGDRRAAGRHHTEDNCTVLQADLQSSISVWPRISLNHRGSGARQVDAGDMLHIQAVFIKKNAIDEGGCLSHMRSGAILLLRLKDWRCCETGIDRCRPSGGRGGLRDVRQTDWR